MKKFSKSIKTQSLALDNKAVIVRIFASILIALSGLILFSDKVVNFELENTYGFRGTSAFIWVLSQTLSPIILILGAIFRPYKIAYTIPVYIYAIQLIWVFRSDLKIDNVLLHVYASGAVIAFIISVIVINQIFKNTKTVNEHKISFLEKALDLSINLRKKKNND